MVKAGMAARRFSAEVIAEPHQAGARGSSLVKIFDGCAQIGKYRRNHPGWAKETFEPFEIDGAWYALYSPDYTSTRVMRLLDCADLGGEESNSHGFCPVEFFVPRYKKVTTRNRSTEAIREDWSFEAKAEKLTHDVSDPACDRTIGPWISLNTGFVAGCIWGDDNSWKLEVIDLSKAAKGIIVRAARFGHLELAHGMSLADSLEFERFMPHWELRATVIRQECRDVATGQLIDPYE